VYIEDKQLLPKQVFLKQEDGFVYGFWDGSKVVADNIKVVFKAISGNLNPS